MRTRSYREGCRTGMRDLRLHYYRVPASLIPQPTKRQRIGNKIDAALIFAWSDFVNVNDRLQIQWWMRLTQGRRSSG